MSNLDPIRQALEAFDAQRVEGDLRRPDRATAEQLLACNGKEITVVNLELIEDVDGIPAGITTTTTTATLTVDLAYLGWTEAEWANLTITE